jgi:thiosulfate/3-mercaptopyruvate sulfurtransferase
MQAKLRLPRRSALRTLLLSSVLMALCLALLSGSALAAERWTDISEEQWATGYGVTADEVAAVAAGYADGTFRPTLSVSRGHFAKMAVTGLDLQTGGPAISSFSDVAVTDALFPWIEGAVAAGVISGYEDGTFRPTAPVTRQQADSILGHFLANRELGLAGHIAGDRGEYLLLDAWYAAEGAGVLAEFADAGSVSTAHAPATAYLVHRGVMEGSARSGGVYLDPLGDLTRAQAVVLILRVGGADVAPPPSLDPFVSTDWLKTNLGKQGLVVIDLRGATDYAAGHIPGSISVPFSSNSAWARSANELTLELPPQADLLKTIGDCGVRADSSVVLVGGVAQVAPTYPLVDTARVAATLAYAGVEKVAIMQGGYQKWATEGKASTSEAPLAQPVAYGAAVDGGIFVSTEYVKEHIGVATIVDTRTADVYFGVTPDAAAPKAGHIPTARSLPTQWVWQTGGTYVSADLAQQMAAGVIGPDKGREIIVYCTFGGTASAWWFVLTQVLGYRDVKLYDGSAQAWAKDNDMVAFTWGL